MSKETKSLVIEPGQFVKSGDKEMFIMSGYDCPRCNGTGYFVGAEETDPRVTVGFKCDACKGSGMMKAVVTIEWQADIV